MTKDELIGCCEQAINAEESANQIYMKHLSAILLRSGMPADDLRQARGILEYLIGENTEHKRMLQGLIERIRKEESDVY